MKQKSKISKLLGKEGIKDFRFFVRINLGIKKELLVSRNVSRLKQGLDFIYNNQWILLRERFPEITADDYKEFIWEQLESVLNHYKKLSK